MKTFTSSSTKNSTALCLIASLFLSSSVFAGPRGTKEGGGGGGLVCLTPQGTTVELLDIAEARERGAQFSPDPKPSPSISPDVMLMRALEGAHTSLNNFVNYYQSANERDQLAAALPMIPVGLGNLHRITSGPRLAPPTDAAIQNIPENCNFVGIASYDDAAGTLNLDERYFYQLSPKQQAALFVHETLWWLSRRLQTETSQTPGIHFKDLAINPSPLYMPVSDDTDQQFAIRDSRPIRLLVGNLFATNPIVLSFSETVTSQWDRQCPGNAPTGVGPALASANCWPLLVNEALDHPLPKGSTEYLASLGPLDCEVGDSCQAVYSASNQAALKIFGQLDSNTTLSAAIKRGFAKVTRMADGTPHLLSLPLPGYQLTVKSLYREFRYGLEVTTDIEAKQNVHQNCADQAILISRQPGVVEIQSVQVLTPYDFATNLFSGQCLISYITL